ncbi:hypothetical protein ACP275_13G079900 [Erythranthe tilingii]
MADHVYYLFLVFFSALITCSSHAHQLIVGGKNGWVVNPSENYNHWAERLRFQVNDTLLFKYKKESDSVVVVNSKADYDNCNTGNPKLKLDDGNSVYKFDRSGPVFFISGNKSNCAAGQKLIIVVMAVRNHRSPPKAPSPAPTPAPSPALPPAEGPAPETSDGPSANSTPADVGGEAPHPHRRSLAAPAWNPSVALVLTVSLVLSVCGGGFIVSL